MIFSNQRATELSDEQFMAESEQLRGLRDEHYRELIRAGTVDRMLGTTALSNMWAPTYPLHEGSFVYPYRYPLAHMSGANSSDLYRDVDITSLNSAVPGWGYLSLFGDLERPNYAICLGRKDKVPNGWDQHRYYVGMLLDAETSLSVSKTELNPVPGMQEADLVLVRRQIAELLEESTKLGLNVIDPLTACEGRGIVVQYEDSDYGL